MIAAGSLVLFMRGDGIGPFFVLRDIDKAVGMDHPDIPELVEWLKGNQYICEMQEHHWSLGDWSFWD